MSNLHQQSILSKLKNYTNIAKLHLVLSIIRTKLFHPDCRLMRIPFYIRGKQFVLFSEGFTSGVGLRIDAFPINETINKIVTIGKNVEVNDYVHIAAINNVTIGDNVLIASRVFISDHNHGNYAGINQCSPNTVPKERPLFSSPVFIEDNVWLGESVSILPGVTIGRGCVIGANSVVSKNIPAYSIAIGIPAKVVKKYNFNTFLWEKI
jgi:lipopolysaccharide O-acetyltransferase